MSTFIYPPINKAESELRILDLDPGFPGDPVICKLFTVSLSSSIEYEALSYTWGEASLCKELRVNGSAISVTENAFLALTHLRDQNSVRRLWIDAICINQLNDSERAHQVKLMKDIYQRAARVLVWLGPTTGESNIGLDLLEDLFHKASSAFRSGAGVPTQNFQQLPIAPLHELMHILRRPYWRRAWIIQETAVATQEPLIGCGQRWLSWKVWKYGLSQIFAYHTANNARFVTESIDSDHKLILSVLGLCNRFLDLDWIRAISSHKRGIENPKHGNLQDILRFSMGREASDPRDRIFAVLGLIESQENLCPMDFIAVDYSKELKHIYWEVVNFSLKTEKCLDILFFKNHLRHATFPSWLPDFSSTSRTYPSLEPESPNVWYASKHTLPQPPRAPDRSPILLNDIDTLLVAGHLVDTIDMVLNLEGVRTNPAAVFRQIRLFAFHNLQDMNATDNQFYIKEAVWRTLLANQTPDGRVPCTSSFRHAFTTLLYLEPGQPFNHSADASLVEDFLNATCHAVSFSPDLPHRRLFITRTGRFGLGPPDCEPGDIVSLVWSFSMPMILRSCNAFYELVGNAYVHGMMNGEDVPNLIDGEDWVCLEIR